MRTKGVEKAYEITDAKIQFVSLVDKAANKRKFLITKQEAGVAEFSTYGRIVKADAESHYVTGIVYEPMVEDVHGNFMTEAEIEKACHWFTKNGNQVDLQHSFEPLQDATVVENWVTKADCNVEGQPIKKGTWMMTVEVADPKVWEGIKNGDITGFSMGGLGNYSEEDTNLNRIEKRRKGSEEPQTVEKQGKELSSKNQMTLQDIYDCLGAFLESVNSGKIAEPVVADGDEDKKKDEDETEEALTDVDVEIVPEEEEKEDKNVKKEESQVTKSEVELIVKEAVAAEMAAKETAPAEAPITEAEIRTMVSEAIQKAEADRDEEVTAEQVQEMVEKSVEKALGPLLKSRGVPTNLNGETVEKAAEQHYLHGIL